MTDLEKELYPEQASYIEALEYVAKHERKEAIVEAGIFIFICLTILFVGVWCWHSQAEPSVNVMAHVGTSFMIDTIAYKVQKPYMSKTQAEILSAIETLAVGYAYKASEHFPSNISNSMLENTLGIGLSIGVRYEF